VLIVDDEPFNLIILEAILKELGFHSRKASNGYEAL
jgi:CheY-like chemotaxis protein